MIEPLSGLLIPRLVCALPMESFGGAGKEASDMHLLLEMIAMIQFRRNKNFIKFTFLESGNVIKFTLMH